MTKKLEIPTNHEAISLDWLTEALRSTGTINRAAVRSLKLESMRDGPGQAGQLARFKLNYTYTEDNAPASLIAKLSSDDAEVRTTLNKLNYYEKEVRFYQELALQVQVPIPHCYYSDIDPETGHSILLLEDLTHLRVVDNISGCNLAEAELVVQHLAKFHAHWWESPQLQATSYLTPFDFMAEYRQERYQEWWLQFAQKVEMVIPGYQLPAAFLELGYQYGFNLAQIFAQLNHPPITLIHMDTHADNLLFGVNEKDVSVTFLDWQLYGSGRGVSDVTNFMIPTVPTALRRQTEHSLLQSYHNLLVEHGVQGYDFEQCWADYQLAFFRNLFMAVGLLGWTDISRPYVKAAINAGLPRLIAFSEDHSVSKFL